MNPIRFVPVLLTLAIAGCASSGVSEQRTGIYEYELTEEDFRQAPYPNLYDVINALRGNWLGRSLVAVDGLLVGDTNELRAIRTLDVHSVQFLNSHQAKTLFGLPAQVRRAILVTTKRGMAENPVAKTARIGR